MLNLNKINVDIGPVGILKNASLNLNQGDFSTANIISEKINEIFGPDVAVPLDATSIKVRSPEDPGQKVSFVSLLENLKIY